MRKNKKTLAQIASKQKETKSNSILLRVKGGTQTKIHEITHKIHQIRQETQTK